MNIGFVGLGAMGKPMAMRIAAAGHQPVVFDVDSATAQHLAAKAWEQ
jgi:3-hydroxyisobutyrate dehydrogenase-like beta-hydroxyacid dehydrogenase